MSINPQGLAASGTQWRRSLKRSRCLLMRFVKKRAYGGISPQAPRPMKDGKGAIRIRVNPHCRLDVVVTVAGICRTRLL